jgi:arylformamidase
MLSPEVREREYSPSSCIGGNYQPFIAAYKSESQRARLECEKMGATWSRHSYGHGVKQTLELCLPSDRSAPLSLLVFIHGGYWQELSAEDSLFSALGAIQAGAGFAAIDYTLAPQASLAEIVAEVKAAIGWLYENAFQLGINPNQVVIAGSSAGAHLAATVGKPMQFNRQTYSPKLVVLVSGIYDLQPLIGTSINEALALTEASAKAVSPSLMNQMGFAKSIFCWGEIETEEFKKQSTSFASQLRSEECDCTTFEIPARNHFDVILELTDASTHLGSLTLQALSPL